MVTSVAIFFRKVSGIVMILFFFGTPVWCQGWQPQSETSDAPAANSGETKGAAPPAPAMGGIDAEKDSDHPFRADIARLERNFWFDQKQIYTSPSKIRFSDTVWLVPILGITAGLIQTDGTYSMHLSQNPRTTSRYNNLSNAGLGALLGGAGGMYLLSHVTHNEKWRETGLLSAEAAIDSTLLVEISKYAASRDRPTQGNGRGLFFQQGGGSFPSLHSTVASSVAGIIAHEYPGPFSKVLAYGLAAVIDYSRVHARQHFPSDVFAGQIAGNMIGQNVYTNQHDTELGGEAWKSFRETFAGESAT